MNYLPALATLLPPLLPYLAAFAAGVVLARWLRTSLTPAWMVRLFESEGIPSVRLVLATVVTAFALFMSAAERLPQAALDAYLLFVSALLGLGTAKLIAGKFADASVQKPADTTVVNAKRADVTAQSVVVETPSAAPTVEPD